MKRQIKFGLFLLIVFFPLLSAQAVDLTIPFTSQAPQGRWVQPWSDACEETSLIIVDHYYEGKTFTRDSATTDILNLFSFKNQIYGASLDENIDKMLGLIKKYYRWEGRRVTYPSLNLLKEEVANGRPVIIPAAALELNNPYFNPRAAYHVLVLKGYDDATGEFITNDPGTTYGANYRYSYEVLIAAIHDYIARDQTAMADAPKAVIFTSPINELVEEGSLIKRLDDSKIYLIENQRKRPITSAEIFLANGWNWSQVKFVSEALIAKYPTGITVSSIIKTYQPTYFERSLKSGALIKSKDLSRVYLLENGIKRYVINPQVFINHAWSWSQVKIVSQAFLDSLPTGVEVAQ